MFNPFFFFFDEWMFNPFKSTFVAFSPNSPHDAWWNRCPRKSALQCLATLSFQQASKTKTLLGITQWSPNSQNSNDHRLYAKSQWRSKWSLDSQLFLHMQHNSTTQIFLFWRLSIVRIFLLAVVHMKKATFVATFTLQMLFHGKKWGSRLERNGIIIEAHHCQRVLEVLLFFSFFNCMGFMLVLIFVCLATEKLKKFGSFYLLQK